MKPEMEEQLLITMKGVCEFFERQRKAQKFAWIFLAIFIPSVIGVPIAIKYHNDMKKAAAEAKLNDPDHWSWSDVWEDERKAEYKSAIEKAEYLVKKAPKSPGDNRALGRLYLDDGNLKMARKYLQKSFDLWPCEEARKRLDVLDRLEGKISTPPKVR